MKKWKKKEKSDAFTFNGKVTKGSGNSWYAPGDIKTENFLIECKQTEKKSYSISLTTWDKIYSQALFSYRTPILSLKIQDVDLVVLDKEDFKNILQKNQ